MKARPRVILTVETSTIYGRRLLNGVARFQRSLGGWSVLLDGGQVHGIEPPNFEDIECEGILCRLTSPDWVEALKRSKVPVVDLNDRHGYLGLPRVSSDMLAIGRIAAEHLLDRGFRNIAFCGMANLNWSNERRAGVEAAVRERGNFCGWTDTEQEFQPRKNWSSEREKMSKWLLSLPRPLGIVACNDATAYSVLDACRSLDIAVPEEIALVGVDNAEIFCELCDPPLSSVVPDAERVGFEAARLLDRMMAGEKFENFNLLLPPREVKTRRSSDVLAIDDAAIAAALRYVREHACAGIDVSKVVSHVGVSRSALERGFRSYLGHSPQEEIRRVRLEKVKQLLIETDWSLTRIAEVSGFDYPNYIMVQFKRAFDQTPSQWRKHNQSNFTESLTQYPQT
ncbi:helix-turn-helix domain-containing protein [bacterium]|nr:MAG: helix-turn-helix domain-containing protein [bacterium]